MSITQQGCIRPKKPARYFSFCRKEAAARKRYYKVRRRAREGNRGGGIEAMSLNKIWETGGRRRGVPNLRMAVVV